MVSYRAHTPRRGDLLHVNFSPSAGHEMAGRHYALVLSPLAYNRKSGMVIVCPITSHARGWPYETELPAGLLPDKAGVGAVKSVVLADAVKQIDWREREMKYVATAPIEVVEMVLDKLLTVLEDDGLN